MNWGYRYRNLIKDEVHFREYEKEFKDRYIKKAVFEVGERLDQHLTVRISKLSTDYHISLLYIWLAEFETRTTEMMRVAEESGYTDDLLHEKYGQFVREDGWCQSSSFYLLLKFLRENELRPTNK